MTRYLVLAPAVLVWLLLTRVPADGLVLVAMSFAWGLVFGAVLAHWTAGPALLVAAIVGDYIALAMGWFVFLADFWFIPPLVAATAGLLSGAALSWQPWRSSPHVNASRRGTGGR